MKNSLFSNDLNQLESSVDGFHLSYKNMSEEEKGLLWSRLNATYLPSVCYDIRFLLKSEYSL